MTTALKAMLILALVAVPAAAQAPASPAGTTPSATTRTTQSRQPPTPVLRRAARDTSYLCITCHAENREAFVQGVHAERGIKCHDCHGGNPLADTLPAAHAGRFTGKPTKAQTVALCASCHADPNKMRPYGLPSGEMAEFTTSRHGRLLLQGHDDNAPSCIDCHDAHLIRRPDDARSDVYPTNIPATCGRCHTDKALMARYRIPTDQVSRFEKSAHGKALLEQKDFAAPSCIGCHGSHSALPPSVTQVSTVCGRCHVPEGLALNVGPHGPAAASGKLEGCLGCHTNHDTEKVPANRLAATCTKCHAEGTSAHATGVQMQRLMVDAEADMQAAEEGLKALALVGRRTGDARFRYQTALTAFQEAGRAQHDLDVPKLEALTRRVRSISRDIGAMQETHEERRWEHRLFLAVVWFLAISAIYLSAVALRRLEGPASTA
jgi:DNA-directed RNA polymerase subunit RPC12/RpoP